MDYRIEHDNYHILVRNDSYAVMIDQCAIIVNMSESPLDGRTPQRTQLYGRLELYRWTSVQLL